MKSIAPELIRLAYYDASDGPRLVFFGPREVNLKSLQDFFRRLAASEGELYEVHQQAFISAHGATKLTACCVGPMFKQEKEKPLGLRRVRGTSVPEFEWRRTAEGWDYLAQLIDALVTRADPGHQYLTSYPSEDAIVVVSKGEYDDSVLQAC